MGITGCISKYEDNTSGLPVHSSVQSLLQLPADAQRGFPLLQFLSCPLHLGLSLGITEKVCLLAPSLQLYTDEICPESAFLQAQQS